AWPYAVPPTLPAGTYRVSVGVFSGDWATLYAWSSQAATFQVGEHLAVSVYVLDFDPLMSDGRPLTVARGWDDPLALDDAYRAAVTTASGGVVEQRIVATSVVRGYPPKEGGFTFTNAQYLGCLADSSPTYCGALIDYARVLNTAYDAGLGS